MNRIFIYLSIFILLLTSCSDDNSDLKNASYSSLYDELVMQYTSLDSISSLTSAPKETLVKLRYGIIHEDPDLTETLRKIISAYRLKDKNKLNSIKENKRDINSLHDEADLTKDAYDSINRTRNQKFGEELPVIISNFVSENVDGFIESKYTLLNAIPNTWNYYTKSHEDFANDFLKDINTSSVGTDCENYYIERVNNYKNVICEESKIIGNEVSIPDFTIIPGENSIEINDALNNLIIERTRSQIAEISSDIFWDIIATLAVTLIISLLVNNAVNNARDRAVKRFLDNARWESGAGIKKNVAKILCQGLGTYDEYTQEKVAIKTRYNSWKYIIDICLFIISFAISWYVFIIPQLKTEFKINKELSTKIIESSNTLNMNPERIINRYLNIDSDEVTEIEEESDEIDSSSNGNNVSNNATDIIIPEWVPEPIRSDLAASNYSLIKTAGRFELSHNYEGFVNEYPIVMKLDLGNDGIISGKYAFKSILQKYGDRNSSWFIINGAVFLNDSDSPRFILRSLHPDTSESFEFFDMMPGMSGLEGSMVNVIHLDDMESNLYRVSLQPE